jgi:hypothetical protein
MTTDVVCLVVGVARLGEKDLRGWWKGHAIDRTGQYVLSSMFRRTWKPAALELDMAAASRMHRELLGRSTALHLFSDLLPFRRWAIGWLAEQKTAPEPDSMRPTAPTRQALHRGKPRDRSLAQLALSRLLIYDQSSFLPDRTRILRFHARTGLHARTRRGKEVIGPE